MTYTATEFLVSGVLSIPYALFLMVICYEHAKRRRWMQFSLISFVMLSFSCRSVWYILSYCAYDGITDIFSEMLIVSINRLAELCQCTSTSILCLIWIWFLLMRKLNNFTITSMPQEALQYRVSIMRQYYAVLVFGVVCNIFLWGSVMSTVDPSTSNYNHITLIVMCLVEAIVVLIIGIVLSVKIFDDCMEKATADDRYTFVASVTQKSSRSCIDKVQQLFAFTFDLSTQKNFCMVERKMLNSVLVVSVSLCMIDTLRLIVFTIGLLAYDEHVIPITQNMVNWNAIAYPWLFYEIPDFLSAFLVSFYTSTPDGLYYTLIIPLIERVCCVKMERNAGLSSISSPIDFTTSVTTFSMTMNPSIAEDIQGLDL